jgi:hypothetical protein
MPIEEKYVVNASSVGFSIEPLSGNGPGERWLAAYSSGGKTAKFRIEFDPRVPLADKESRMFDVRGGEGRLVAEPGSNASALLASLRTPWKPRRFRQKFRE